MSVPEIIRRSFILLSGVLAACAAVPEQQDTLYLRLGGGAHITQIVNETIDLSSKNPRASRSFDGVNLSRTKASAAAHLCAISGEPCKYAGENMTMAHTGLRISSTEFDVMDGYLEAALDRHNIDGVTKHELQRLLAPMKAEIVGK